ncbi:RHS repeat-associated core domain-containing protein [Chitinophaga sp. CF118]|uniref:RHS repeat-associated core domain-containing protein n=1 Tax=Chitinophaga sp. CF118 TaxID=1884367 RepID=UPI0008F2C93E|nr:RHS repeat-associated core domain-containing protein [Chitinophaga sp. CF118]SFF06486.1 RHS repeat-associated core domain-containing protein [Chitinophaga sp. CF118]
MLVSNKHFTPVIGLDIHIVILFGFPVPLPHPYIGFVLDPMDYIPFIGATTKINHVPRGKSDTSGLIIILFHIPMGGPFLLAPMIGHDSVNFFGSKKVKVEGNLMSPSGHMLMTCNDIGIPLSLQPGKKMKPIPSMYLPTSFSIPLSFGKPVMVGGPFVPDWSGALLNLVMSFGFGALMKGLGKGLKSVGKGLKKANWHLKGKLGESNKLSKVLCKLGFEPVDLVQGIVIYEGTDFELPGPIPLKWERCWNSDSAHNGLLGHGTQLSYDMRIVEALEGDLTGVLLGDGRGILFEALPYTGQSDYNRHERMTLTRTDLDEYQLFNHKERLRYHFRKLHPLDEQYRLYTILNEAGFMISFHYNSKGQLMRVIDSAGRHLHLRNDSEGRIAEITAHHRGATRLLVQYGYNDDGDLTRISDALGQTTHIRYRNHLMVEKTDRDGQIFYWEYDSKGRCKHTWGNGGILEGWIEYHPEDGYNLITNSQGGITTYYYTPDFVVTQIKDPLGNSSFIDYTDDFEVYREIDEDANITGYTYDEQGNRTGVVQPDGSACTFNYDADNRLILTTDPQGSSRAYIYYKGEKHAGLLHTITEADGSMSVFRYNDQNLLIKVENAQGRETLLEYDEDFNLSGITLPDAGHSSWKYDSWGHCISTTNPLKQAQYFHYDSLGRVTEVRLPDGNHIQFQYNAYEEIIQIRDKHHNVHFEYTPLGSLKMREENGAKVHYVYNKDEQLIGIVNEHGEMYRFTRNQRGDIIKETGFDGLTRDYERDATGKIIKVHRPGKRWTEYEYDYNGRLTRAEYSDGSWETYSYNRNGQLIEAVNEHSTVKLQRDVMGRLVQESQNGYTITSTYDRNGKRKAVQSSLGANIQMQHDAAGNVIDIQASIEGLHDPWTTHIERNLLGLEIERTLPGNVKSSWSYDKAGMPTGHTVSSGKHSTRNRHYRWDANQQLKQIINGINGGAVKFGHDDFGNLAWAQYENGEYDYRMPDKAGNLHKTQERKDRKYKPGGKLEESSDTRFIYDEEGNLLRKIMTATPVGGATWEYEWYGNGMLRKVIRPDGKTVEFRYDPLGRRIEKQYNGKLTRFLWDGNILLHEWNYPAADKPAITLDESGDLQSDPEPVPAETLATWVFEESTFTPAAKIINGRKYSIITDYLGTPCEVYDEAGEKVWECELDIYGKVRKSSSDKAFIPFRYKGQYEDVETGLCYNRFRYYSPDDGIYINQDPIRLHGGHRLYAYVHDPNIWLDIFGLAESVYQLIDKDGNTVYYGITDRTPLERANEHVRDGKEFVHMEVLAEDLTHDQARSLEGGLIRQRLRERIDDYNPTDSIEEKLERSGLLNKNRGREIERWNPKNPLSDVPKLEEPRKVIPTAKCK